MARKRKSRGRSGSPGAGFLLLAFVILAGLVYWLSRPASPGSAGQRSEARAKKEQAEKPSARKSEAGTGTEQAARTKLEKGVYNAAAKLRIANRDIKRSESARLIRFEVPVDPSQSDLTFANMIIKGEIERQGGTFQSGVEKGRRQTLTFEDAASGLKYEVQLFYKKADSSGAAKYLAIIVDDFGNNGGNLLSNFAKTNPAVCFAILPNTPYAQQALKVAAQTGHETLIHVPMEPLNYPREDPGDDAIFVHLSPSEINRRMERFIKQLPGCIGINNHMGSFATSDESTMQAVMQCLRKHNLLFVDSRTTGTSVAYNVARKNLVPAVRRDIFLDEPDLSDATLDKKLDECLSLSSSRSYVVAIMHCHTAEHLSYLNRFIARAGKTGLHLVPVSQLEALKLPAIQ